MKMNMNTTAPHIEPEVATPANPAPDMVAFFQSSFDWLSHYATALCDQKLFDDTMTPDGDTYTFVFDRADGNNFAKGLCRIADSLETLAIRERSSRAPGAAIAELLARSAERSKSDIVQ